MNTEILKRMSTRMLIDNQTKFELYFVRHSDSKYVDVYKDATDGDAQFIRTISASTFVRAKLSSILSKVKLIALAACATIFAGMLVWMAFGIQYGMSQAEQIGTTIVAIVSMALGFYCICTIDNDL